MSTLRWRGGASALSQVNTWTFGGTWEAADVVRATIGSKVVEFTVGSTVVATIVDNIVLLWNGLSASAFPEFRELTASRSSSNLVLTMDTPGVPFTCTLEMFEAGGGAADSQTIEGAQTATTGTAAVANYGPWSWDVPENWAGGAIPVDTDDVIVDEGTWPIKYGISQSGIDLTSLRILTTDSDNFQLGLPEVNEDGAAYPEYRTTYLTLGTATTVEVRTTSSRVNLNLGSNAFTANVYQTGRGDSVSAPALLLKGTSSSNILNATGDCEIGVAVFGGEAANLAGGLKVGPGAAVWLGAGVTTGAITNDGGALRMRGAVGTSLTQTEGLTVIDGTGAVAQLTIRGGLVVLNTTGTVGGATVVADTGILDLSRDERARTFTNPIDIHGRAARFLDPLKVAGSIVIDLNQGAQVDQLLLGKDYRITRGATA